MANLNSFDPAVFEREMLQAAASETAPLAARRRALANLGLLSIAPPALGAANAGRVAAKAMWWKAPLAKLGIVVGIGGAMAGGAVALRQPPAATSAALQQTRADAASGRARGATAARADSEAVHARELLDAPTTVSGHAAAGALPARLAAKRRPPEPAGASPEVEASAPSARKAADSMRDEIDLLDRARAAVRAGKARAALGALDEYFARHPNGELRQEAALIRDDATRSK